MHTIYQAFKELSYQFPWIGIHLIRSQQWRAKVSRGTLEQNSCYFDSGAYVEVRSSDLKHVAYSCTSNLSKHGLYECAQRAYQRACLLQKWGLAPLSPSTRSNLKGQYETPTKKPVTPQHFFNELIPFLKETTNQMKQVPSVIEAVAQAFVTREERLYLNSNGCEIHQIFHLVGLNWNAVAQGNNDTQSRSFSGHSKAEFQGGLEHIDFPYLREQTKRISWQAKELIDAPPCPSGTMDILLDPHQMYIQIHESIGHPLELDRILGDERNYAGWSFVKLEDFGQLQYGSSLLNVVFDPHQPDALSAYAFDDGGMRAEKVFLIKNGLLLNPLGGAESQERSKLKGVANFRTANWNRAPIDRMANIDLLPGTSSFSEMLEAIEFGVYIETNRSWSIDDYRRNFQFSAEYGRVIRNGKLGEVVKNPGYRGQCQPFWHSLTHVGDSSTVARSNTYFCGKGEPSQIIRVSHAAPVCHFRNIEVFGG